MNLRVWVPCGLDPEKRGRIERMSNILWSPRLEMIWVYFPKAMCSTIRQFFIEMHKVFNPNFDAEHTKITYHKLHNKKRFQYVDPKTTPVSRAILVIRDPRERFLSAFFDKHVLKRQWVFLTLHNYRKLRVWLDVHSLDHNLENVLRFVEEHHFLDVHDCPMLYQLPLHVLLETQAHLHVWTTRDPVAQKMQTLLGPLLREKDVLPARRDAILHESIPLLAKHQNALPRFSSSSTSSGVADDLPTIPCGRLKQLYAQRGFPEMHAVLHHAPPALVERLNNLYHQDTEMVRILQEPPHRRHESLTRLHHDLRIR